MNKNNDNWQLIETAPKDGTKILLSIARPYTLSYRGNEKYHKFYVVSRFCNQTNQWTEINYDKNWKDILIEWMPLPKTLHK